MEKPTHSYVQITQSINMKYYVETQKHDVLLRQNVLDSRQVETYTVLNSEAVTEDTNNVYSLSQVRRHLYFLYEQQVTKQNSLVFGKHTNSLVKRISIAF